MFDILVDLPLFRGVTHERIADTVGLAKFHFLRYNPGDTIANQGDDCIFLRFIISGKIKISIANRDERLIVSETLEAPDVIAPDYLFGTNPKYPGSIVAVEPTSIVQIPKSDYIKILATDQIFLLNYVNYLSMNAQKCVEGILSVSRGSLEERFATWVVALTQPSAKDILITCKQKDLYSMFGVQRSAFMQMLEYLADKGYITYDQTQIRVNDRRTILSLMRNGLG